MRRAIFANGRARPPGAADEDLDKLFFGYIFPRRKARVLREDHIFLYCLSKITALFLSTFPLHDTPESLITIPPAGRSRLYTVYPSRMV